MGHPQRQGFAQALVGLRQETAHLASRRSPISRRSPVRVGSALPMDSAYAAPTWHPASPFQRLLARMSDFEAASI